MPRKFFDSPNLSAEQSTLVHSLEAIGDLLLHETAKRKRNSIVFKGLQEINTILLSLIQLKQTNPSKFRSLNQSIDFSEFAKSNPEDASLLSELSPSDQFPVFSSGLDQLLRIHEGSLEAKNSDVSSRSVLIIIDLLQELAKESQSESLLSVLFPYLSAASHRAEAARDGSAFPATTRWFIRIVNRGVANNSRFHLSNLPIFERHLFGDIVWIVSDHKTDLFERFVSAAHDSLLFDESPSLVLTFINDVGIRHWDVQTDKDTWHDIFQDATRLEESLPYLFNLEDLDRWLKTFALVGAAVKANSKVTENEIEQDSEDDVRRSCIRNFLFHRFQVIFLAMGAFCLSRNRTDFINYMWEYKQPQDADATWIGDDPVPIDVTSSMTIYFS
ncbi:MAG: hypothetical protein KC964_30670, partial [Candidatus Omnitrophica bacterium]|nr:hypothetical protein [Candidatus Omnitrophota bacterium]